jgi:hypothetical protein
MSYCQRWADRVGRIAVLLSLWACSSNPDRPAQGGSSNTGGRAGASTGGGGASTGGAAATGGAGGGAGTGMLTGAGGSAVDTPATLPFAVDLFYAASGFMGDGATPGLIVLDSICQSPRPSGAMGQCYRFTYQRGSIGWGGVYWQYPANNWGASPGKRIASGARRVRFYAAGATGGEAVSFIVFGIGVADTAATYRDPATVTLTQTLTTTMTAYEINLTGQTYDAVIGGFGWVAPPAGQTLASDAGAPLVFYVDDIEWQ